MIASTDETEVVILGAGISGLLFAAQLIRMGVIPTVVAQRASGYSQSQHVHASAWSMEILQQLGLPTDKLERFEIEGLTVQKRRLVFGSLAFQPLKDSAFPILQIFKPSALEQLLVQYLTQHACPIRWNVSVDTLEPTRHGYRLQLNSNGTSQEIHTAWLINADQADKILNKTKIAEDPLSSGSMFSAQIQVQESLNRHLHFFLSKQGNIQLLPVDGKGLYQITGKLQKHRPSNPEEMRGLLKEILGFDLPIQGGIIWNTERILGHTAQEKLAHRAISIGADVDRSHPIIWGASINLAIQNTHNLAWKLAYVIKGKMPSSILYSYTRERDSVEKALQSPRSSTKLMRFIKPPFGLFRNRLIQSFFSRIQRNPDSYTQYMRMLGQTNLHYRNSDLSIHLSSSKTLKAGDRLPNLQVYHEKAKKLTSLHEWCSKTGFILLLLGHIPESQLFAIAQWITQKYSPFIHLFYLPYSKRNKGVFEALSVQHEQRKMLLIRPDMYIACLHDECNTGLIDTYMLEVLQWNTA